LQRTLKRELKDLKPHAGKGWVELRIYGDSSLVLADCRLSESGPQPDDGTGFRQAGRHFAIAASMVEGVGS